MTFYGEYVIVERLGIINVGLVEEDDDEEDRNDAEDH